MQKMAKYTFEWSYSGQWIRSAKRFDTIKEAAAAMVAFAEINLVEFDMAVKLIKVTEHDNVKQAE